MSEQELQAKLEAKLAGIDFSAIMRGILEKLGTEVLEFLNSPKFLAIVEAIVRKIVTELLDAQALIMASALGPPSPA